MIIDQSLSDKLVKIRRTHYEEREAKHEPSGKLSASSLGKPLQWQILKYIGIPRKYVDDYALGLFERGNQVEEYIISHLPTVETQKEVFYRGTIGIIDAMIDTSDHFMNVGVIPHEIKSVKNTKYKRILDTNAPDEQYILQACQNALAINASHFAVVIVASDDLRMTPYLFETETYKHEVDKIIDTFEAQKAKKEVPVFTPRYKWQENPMYNDYESFSNMSVDEIVKKLKTEYPEIYKKFVS